MDWTAPGYTEIKPLGAGGSGRVVLAVHNETGVRVAIKYLSDELRRDPVAVGRFQSEARLLTTLQDQHIARLWEYVQDSGGAAIVMELVNGVSLRALLREHGATTPESALVVLKGSLLGLSRAHQSGVVHRDYKPENVIVRDDGVSKLVDFGIAVRQGTTMRAEGTPPYMAPEMWSGETASPATDVYAATAVFFECLTGHRPYRSTEPSVLGYQHLHAPIPLQDLPAGLHALVRRGMAKDPADRPPGALTFVRELEAAALAAYGEEWEERGRRRLAALVALLPLLLPQPPAAVTPVQTGTTLFRTVLRGMRHNAVKLAAGVTTVLVAGGVAWVALASRDQPPVKPVDVVVAGPTSPSPVQQAGTPSQIDPPEVTTTPVEELSPDPTPTVSAAVTPEVQVTPTVKTTPTVKPPTTKPTVKPTATTKPTAKPTVEPTVKPTVKPTVTPTPTPTPTVTVTPKTEVAALTVAGLRVGENGTATATVRLRTTGLAQIPVTARFAVAGEVVQTQTVRLRGATAYSRSLSRDLGEYPCGKRVTVTVAAPGFTRSASVDVPKCPTRVTGLRAAVQISPSGSVIGRVDVQATGTDAVELDAEILLGGERVNGGTTTLSGQTAYQRTVRHAFRQRPCGSTVTLVARAGGRRATDSVEVSCPAAVRSIALSNADLNADGLFSAAVTVVTANSQPVTLTVAYRVGESTVGTETFELSGDTTYTRKLGFVQRDVKCGTTWSIVASTRPASADGPASASGRTGGCID
ncbi:serine/threonine-protein kinase [Nonomuraea sp. NPDC050663]|uniref:serine/threonine-protein kinase n=1 Tax=Nonomuraea sp. NPDC050663 TaxID=3364370 RepID=UPI0037B5774D